MSRKIPLVAALVAAALVIPTTAAQAADSGLTPTVSPFTYGDITAGQGYYNWADPIVLTNTTGSDVTLSAGVDTVTSSNDGWGWIGVGGSPYPSCISQSLVVAPGDPAPSCPTLYGRVCSAIRPPRSQFTATKEPPTSQSAPTSKRPSPTPAQRLLLVPASRRPAPKTHTFYVKNDGNIDLHTSRSPSQTGSRGTLLPHRLRWMQRRTSHARSDLPDHVSFEGPATGKSALSDCHNRRDPGGGDGDGPTLQFDITVVRSASPFSATPCPRTASRRRRERGHPRRRLHLQDDSTGSRHPPSATATAASRILGISVYQAHRKQQNRDLVRPRRLGTPRRTWHLPLPRPSNEIRHHPLRRTRPHHRELVQLPDHEPFNARSAELLDLLRLALAVALAAGNPFQTAKSVASSKPAGRGSPTVGRFDSCAAPLRKYLQVAGFEQWRLPAVPTSTLPVCGNRWARPPGRDTDAKSRSSGRVVWSMVRGRFSRCPALARRHPSWVRSHLRGASRLRRGRKGGAMLGDQVDRTHVSTTGSESAAELAVESVDIAVPDVVATHGLVADLDGHLIHEAQHAAAGGSCDTHVVRLEWAENIQR